MSNIRFCALSVEFTNMFFCYNYPMDPLTPQVDEPVASPEEDAPVIAPPTEPAPQPPQTDAPQVTPTEPSEPPEEGGVSPSNLDIAETSSTVTAPPVSVPTPIDNVYTNANEPENVPTTPVPAVPVEPAPVIPPPAAVTPPMPAFDPHSADELNFLRTVLAPRAWASHRARTQAKLDRIMALAREKGQIDRKDVRDLLNRSKPACTRYLTTLVKQGKLTRHRVLDDNVYRVVG